MDLRGERFLKCITYPFIIFPLSFRMSAEFYFFFSAHNTCIL